MPSFCIILYTQFIFAYMVELLYFPVEQCEDGVFPLPAPFGTCQEYFDDISEDIQ